MRQKEFKAVFDGEKYVLPQELKYRIKNRISEITATAKPFVKRSVSAMASIILASVLVVTAAAVGGIALFKSIYGENIEPIMPYSEIINTKASDENYELTLHEAVADEYTTAYIFSVKRLTVGASEAVESDSSIVFKGFWLSNDSVDRYFEYYNPQDNPEMFVGYNGYDKLKTQIFYANRMSKEDTSIVLIRRNTAYNAENEARYLIRPIDNLKTEDTDYYALYIVNGEDQVLSIGIGKDSGPELALPNVTQKAPSVTSSVQEYYRQYLKQTHSTMIFNNAPLPDLITITPLAVYVKNTLGYQRSHSYINDYGIRYIESAFYRTAELLFNDGTEKSLGEMSQDEKGIMLSNTIGVYLFDEVLDTSFIKSFMVYDTVEFPMDKKLPVINRETGAEIVPKYETLDLMYDFGTSVSGYLDSMYPEERKQNATYCGSPHYQSENSCTISGYDCYIILTVYELNEVPFTDAANRTLEEYRMKYNWNVSSITAKDGTSSLGEVKYAKVNFTVLDGKANEMNIFFFEKDGKLITLQLSEQMNAWPSYSLDALLKLITFN